MIFYEDYKNRRGSLYGITLYAWIYGLFRRSVLMLSEDIGLPIKSELKIFEEIYSLEDILLYLKEFGITKFTTLEEAEKYKEEMEKEIKHYDTEKFN